jgi:hypothetical protein
MVVRVVSFTLAISLLSWLPARAQAVAPDGEPDARAIGIQAFDDADRTTGSGPQGEVLQLADTQAAYAPAPATTEAADPPFEVKVTPYLWLPWIHTGVHPRDPALPSVSSTVTPGDLLRHITWIPFMGAAEIRSGQFTAAIDFIHAPLKGDIQTGDLLFAGGSGDLTMNTGTGMFFYRPWATSRQYFDIGAGFRVWNFDGEITLEPARLPIPPVTLTRGATWTDGLVGGRYHVNFENGFGATAYGDVGGGGARIDWQLVGSVDYKPKGWPVLSAGFRSLNFNFQAEHARFNSNFYAPYIAATFRF